MPSPTISEASFSSSSALENTPPLTPSAQSRQCNCLLQFFFILFFFAMPAWLYWSMVLIYWLYYFKSTRFESDGHLNLFPMHKVKQHSFSGKIFQKVTKMAIKWTFDIREEISHFSKNMSQLRRLRSFERTLNRQLSRTGDDLSLVNVWDNFIFTQDIFDFYNIGSLTVTIHKADLTDYKYSKINLFCKLELGSKKHYTKIEQKTLTPNWAQSFTFKIKDIAGPKLEISIHYETVFDNSKLIGNISLPLLEIQTRTRKWFVLQHKSQNTIKGKIFLEFEISYNPIKAALKTIFTPKENKILEDEKIRFNKTHFLRNALRVKHLVLEVIESTNFVKSCLQWDCPFRTLTCLLFILIFVYYIEWYMLPLSLLLLMLRNLVMINLNQNYFEQIEKENLKDEAKLKSSEKFYEKIDQTVNFIINTILENSSFIDRIENLFNFTVPFLSWVFIIALIASTICYYFISMRLVIMAFIINEFTKEFRKVHSCNNILCNNEFYNFFSRVPDMDEKNE